VASRYIATSRATESGDFCASKITRNPTFFMTSQAIVVHSLAMIGDCVISTVNLNKAFVACESACMYVHEYLDDVYLGGEY
jgi:hypothetical protein